MSGDPDGDGGDDARTATATTAGRDGDADAGGFDADGDEDLAAFVEEMNPETGALDRTEGFDDDPERAAFLRDIAEDVRGDTGESEQVAAFLYRVSDLYDPAEEASPEEVYLNVRNIMEVKKRGGLRR
jgi:hypothetical protein